MAPRRSGDALRSDALQRCEALRRAAECFASRCHDLLFLVVGLTIVGLLRGFLDNMASIDEGLDSSTELSDQILEISARALILELQPENVGISFLEKNYFCSRSLSLSFSWGPGAVVLTPAGTSGKLFEAGAPMLFFAGSRYRYNPAAPPQNELRGLSPRAKLGVSIRLFLLEKLGQEYDCLSFA